MPKIPTYPSLTAPDDADELVIEDSISSSTKKITRGDLLAGSPLPADTVDTQAIEDLAVSTGKIAENAVKPNKMDFGAQTSMNASAGTTTSTSFTSSLTTMGTMPAVTAVVPASGSVLVLMTATMHNSTAEIRTTVTYSLSSGNTLSATDNNTAGRSITGRTTTAATATWSGAWLHTGLVAGSTVFQMEAQVQANTGTVGNPTITVIPIGD